MAKEELVYVGINGKVVALSQTNGEIRWSTNLKAGFLGAAFVHVIVEEQNVFATTQGEMFCLDATTGRVKWQNALKGYGTGIASIATRNAHSPVDLAAKITADQQSQSAAAVAINS